MTSQTICAPGNRPCSRVKTQGALRPPAALLEPGHLLIGRDGDSPRRCMAVPKFSLRILKTNTTMVFPHRENLENRSGRENGVIASSGHGNLKLLVPRSSNGRAAPNKERRDLPCVAHTVDPTGSRLSLPHGPEFLLHIYPSRDKGRSGSTGAGLNLNKTRSVKCLLVKFLERSRIMRS